MVLVFGEGCMAFRIRYLIDVALLVASIASEFVF